MLPFSCFLVDVSTSNSSRRVPFTTTTRVSSGWVASMSMRLTMYGLSPNPGLRREGRATAGLSGDVEAGGATHRSRDLRRERAEDLSGLGDGLENRHGLLEPDGRLARPRKLLQRLFASSATRGRPPEPSERPGPQGRQGRDGGAATPPGSRSRKTGCSFRTVKIPAWRANHKRPYCRLRSGRMIFPPKGVQATLLRNQGVLR